MPDQVQPVTELASALTPREIASLAAATIRALNQATLGGGELASPGEVCDIIASLKLMGQDLPELCEQLARFLVAQHEDGQVAPEAGQDASVLVNEVTETLTAAGQAADMMSAALDEAQHASAGLRSAR
jgi:hypothetical protein